MPFVELSKQGVAEYVVSMVVVDATLANNACLVCKERAARGCCASECFGFDMAWRQENGKQNSWSTTKHKSWGGASPTDCRYREQAEGEAA
jgi:hypothetical protein